MIARMPRPQHRLTLIGFTIVLFFGTLSFADQQENESKLNALKKSISQLQSWLSDAKNQRDRKSVV